MMTIKFYETFNKNAHFISENTQQFYIINTTTWFELATATYVKFTERTKHIQNAIIIEKKRMPTRAGWSRTP